MQRAAGAGGDAEAKTMTHQRWRLGRGYGSQGTYSEQGYRTGHRLLLLGLTL